MEAMYIRHQQFIILLLAVLTLLTGTYSQAATSGVYSKKGLSFQLPKDWSVVSDDKLIDEREVVVRVTDTSKIVITMIAKKLLEKDHAHAQLATSLKRFADKFNQRHHIEKFQMSGQVKQIKSHRHGHEGLMESRNGIYTNNKPIEAIREFYRFDLKNTVLFLTLDTNRAEYRSTGTGLGVLMDSLKAK